LDSRIELLDTIGRKLNIITERICQNISNLQILLSDEPMLEKITNVAHIITAAIKSGNKLMICGNGGSAADAQHMAGEFVCRFYKDRDPLPAIALTTDVSIITAVSNDYTYVDIFSRQVRAIGRKGDILFGISTSGSSKNVLEALKIAKEIGIKTVFLTGETKKDIEKISDIVIKTPSSDTPRIQEMHLLIEHIICEIVENKVYG
jgi:D-sedoheptulose 7-phosphate isomerase